MERSAEARARVRDAGGSEHSTLKGAVSGGEAAAGITLTPLSGKGTVIGTVSSQPVAGAVCRQAGGACPRTLGWARGGGGKGVAGVEQANVRPVQVAGVGAQEGRRCWCTWPCHTKGADYGAIPRTGVLICTIVWGTELS